VIDDIAAARAQIAGLVAENFVDPEELELRLREMGWDCAIRRVSSRSGPVRRERPAGT
jgi:hypothetical protein